MGRCYDNWERLVEAVMRREQFRSLSLADSISSSFRSTDSDFSYSSSHQHDNLSFRTTPSPLHKDPMKGGKQSGRRKVLAKTRSALWKGLPIFSGFSSKDYGREERELQWSKAQRTLHGLETAKTAGFSSKQNFEEISPMTELEKKMHRQAHTLKGHIESLAKLKGLDIDSTHKYYTI